MYRAVSHPVILSSKAAIAGAVAGFLGPSAGIGVGNKAAEALYSIKDLFGIDK